MSIVKKITYLLLCLFCLWQQLTLAQQIAYLEKPVTISENKYVMGDLLKNISVQTSVIFSYSQLFNATQQLNYACKNKALRLVLNDILKISNCTYKLKDKYVIIKCEDKPPVLASQLNGYIYNVIDSSAVSKSSVYVKETKHSAITNDYGFFNLTYSKKLPALALSVAKENFKDTTVIIYDHSKQEIVIYLYPVQKVKDSVRINPPIVKDTIVIVKTDTVIRELDGFVKLRNRFKKFNTNFKNISDTLFTKVSLSFVPYISTNRLLSINTVNKYSFNLISGYSKGITGFEIGGILNISEGNVKSLQIAGVANLVAGNVSGLQMAGVINMVGKKTTGLQMAGVCNINRGEVKGIQLAGVSNFVYANVDGTQMSSVYNYAKNLDGLQISGVINQADTVYGFQLAGVLNKAKVLNGTQLSIFNYADTCSGVPIGFFSFVRKGYHKIEIAGDELGFGTASFGTGVDKFHNIFILGINFMQPQLWTYGLGLGSTIKLSKRVAFVTNLSAQQIQSVYKENISTNLLSKLFIGAEFKFHNQFRMGLGPTLSVYNSDVTNVNYASLYSTVAPSGFYNFTYGPINTRIWLGARLYLKLF